MASLHKRKSVDDLNVGMSLPLITPERRARSTSPVKNRHSIALEFFPTLPASTEDQVSILSSNSRLSNSPKSYEHLLKLSRSPISKKLHISKSNYTIPIPLTLQLPPKLSQSAPTSPKLPETPNRSPKKLIFNGLAYEAADSLSDSEKDTSFSRPTSPFKPPSLATSRKKMAKFVQKTQSIPLDQLSMIEEASINSRNSSVKSKELPSCPTSQLSVKRTLLRKPPPDLEVTSPVIYAAPPIVYSTSPKVCLIPPVSRAPLVAPVATTPPSVLLSGTPARPVIVERAPIVERSFIVETEGGDTRSSEIQLPIKLNTEKCGPNQTLADTTIVAQTPLRVNISPAPQFETDEVASLPHSKPYHHNLNLGSEAVLKINKRSFSDESNVLSVSSFSSVGDVLNLHHHSQCPSTKQNARISSSIASYLKQNNLDRNSSFKNDISPAASFNCTQRDEKETSDVPEGTNHQRCESKGLPPLPCVDEDAPTPPLNITRVVTTSADDIEGNDLDEIKLDVDDNNGAGRGFNFPNDSSNVTNSEEARKRKLAKRGMKSSTSGFSLRSSTGQIEIPDLEDTEVLLEYARVKYTGVGFDDLLRASSDTSKESGSMEPIGVPSQAAKEHFQTMYGDRSADTDSDSSFNSQFSKLNTGPKLASPIKKVSESTSLGNISSQSSPIRHARHRSMYNIDFDLTDLPAAPALKHMRSKSIAAPGKMAERPETIAQKSKSPQQEDEETPLILVTEPPKKIQYAVDFKDASASRSHFGFPVTMPNDYYQRSRSSLDHRSVINNSSRDSFSTPLHSDTASSYQSSKTARATASTAPSDSGSVVIDLTKEDYNVHMIKRHDSTMSYRSVIERTSDGKAVEVVLVEEDEEIPREDRDDLLSIYSRYMNDWLERSDTVRSSGSEQSDISANSWANSESNFHVKSMASLRRTQAYNNDGKLRIPDDIRQEETKMAIVKTIRKALPIQAKAELRIPPKGTRTKEGNYFDYSATEKYDFNSFMKQRATKDVV